MEGIPISSETLEQFRNENIEGFSEQPQNETVQLEQLNEAAGWLLKTIDHSLGNYVQSIGGNEKEVETAKWSEEMRAQVSELSIIVGKRNLSRSFLEKTPEFFLCSIIGGKLITTTMLINQIRKRNANAQPEEKKEDE